MRMIKRVVILALVGASFGTLFDYAHVRTGAIVYAHPSAFVVAWWVPFLYMSAAMTIGLTHPVADRVLRRRARVLLTPSRLLGGFVGFCAIWFASGALPFASAAVALMLAPVSLLLWLWLDRTWQGLLIGVATALSGCTVEVVLSRAGLFSHTHPDVLGVALWLPWIYVAASVGLGNIGRALAAREA